MYRNKKIYLTLTVVLTIIDIAVIVWAEVWYQKGYYTTSDDDIINTRFFVTIGVLSGILLARWIRYFNDPNLI